MSTNTRHLIENRSADESALASQGSKLMRLLIPAIAMAFLAGCSGDPGADSNNANPNDGGGTAASPETKAQPKASEAAKAPEPAKPTTPNRELLMNPAAATQAAPATYKVKFETSKGDFVVEVTRGWAPKGADRFYNLVNAGFFDGVKFFRVIKSFMVQFGINGDPAVSAKWRMARIEDDPVTQSNQPGYITFATSGRHSRTTQVFINYGNNRGLDGQGFSPFGKVTSGMDVVRAIYEVGEGPPRGPGPRQDRIQAEGNQYLEKDYPQLDSVTRAYVMP